MAWLLAIGAWTLAASASSSQRLAHNGVIDLFNEQPDATRDELKPSENGSHSKLQINWPPEGAAHRPPAPGEAATTGWKSFALEVPFVLVLQILLIGFFCLFRAVASKEFQQFSVLASSMLWRQCHWRSAYRHLLRFAVPLLFLGMLLPIREWVVNLNSKDKTDTSADGSNDQLKDGVMDFVFTVTLVYVAVLSMVFYVWHVSSEDAAGYRHLLHVSGLSRSAYLLGTGLLEGVAQSLLSLSLMLIVSGLGMGIRMVAWTSPGLLFVLLLTMSLSGTMTGHLLVQLSPSPRIASIISQLIFIVVLFSAPLAPFDDIVPKVKHQSVMALLFPMIPAYRATFELAAACLSGRCLESSDMIAAFSSTRVAMPWQMVFGKTPVEGEPDLTPPEAILSFLGMVALQLNVGFALAVWLDFRYFPTLHLAPQARAAASSQQAAAAGIEGGIKEPALEVRELVHWYGFGSSCSPDARVLSGVSFEVWPGAVLGLLGPNGAGKTSTIRCITGEEAPREGDVTIRTPGDEVHGGAHLGLCPQDTVINHDLNVAQNLMFFALLRGAQQIEAQKMVDDILTASKLQEKRGEFPDALSGGMRRRLAVSCAMIATPAVAVLDEPTTGLDPMSRRDMWEAILAVKKAGSCVLLTTHMLEEAEVLCSSLAVLRKGVVAAKGSVQELKAKWAGGYLLSIDAELGKEDIARAFMQELLDVADKQPLRQNISQITFKVTTGLEGLGHLIVAIAQGQQHACIRHCGVAQCSLEDAFVNILAPKD